MPLWSEPKDAAHIFEMIRALRDIASLVADEEQAAFLSDQSKPHALAMHFLVLGEAANRVSRSTWSALPEIEWQRVANLRHLIAHEYRRIDHTQLWEIATVDAPTLAKALPPLPSPPEIL